MSTLPLPKALTQRRTNSLEQEKENFEKSQAISISKAINSSECPVKEKHVRSAIIGTFHEKGAHTFWSIAMKLPLQENPIVCWKFCHVVHKLLREGYHRVIPDSLRYRQTFLEYGKLWGLLKEGYGKLIQCYCQLIVAKLNFHSRNPKFPGNMTVTDEALDDIGEHDVNVFFQLACEMFDYMDEVLALQQAVFGSLDMARSNSMTNSGQCRLAPLIPCIQDSSQLYDYTVKVLFKLHAALPSDTLCGHRERFLKQFKQLQQFYLSSVNLQYFKHLIQVPLLPENPPNFLVASDLSSHVSPVVILPPQADTPENEPIEGMLIDTSVPERFEQVLGASGDVPDGHQSSTDEAEKDRMIAKLLRENSELRMELQKVRIEEQRFADDLKRHVLALEAQIAENERTIHSLSKENEVLQSSAEDETEAAKKVEEADKKWKASEEKFHKMKDVYTKLREEHIGLLRSKAEIERQLTSVRAVAENAEKARQELNEQLMLAVEEKQTAQERIQLVGERLTHAEASSQENEQLKKGVESLQEQFKALQEASQEKDAEHNHALSELKEAHKRDKDMLQASAHSNLFSILVGVIKEAEGILKLAIDEMDIPGGSSYSGTPESMSLLTGPALCSLKKLQTGFESYNTNPEVVEGLMCSIYPLAHTLAQLLNAGKAVSAISQDIELGDELVTVCKSLGNGGVSLFELLRCKGSSENVRMSTAAVEKSVSAVAAAVDAIKESLAGEDKRKLGDLVEEELSQMDKAIDEAAQRIQDMLHKSRTGDSGIKLEVNSKILDACTALMQAIRELVKASKHLQEEIVGKGKGSGSKKEFYSRNHRWTEGLISASKVVGMGANFLVDAADKVVAGQAKFEELVVASQEIAGATAQLVVASKVKADRGSQRLAELSKASRVLTEATGNVVATAKSCAEMVEDSEAMDFSKLTLHQAKRLEMESQVRVLELESNLQKERVQLAELRRRHYHLAGASEGWDVREENGTGWKSSSISSSLHKTAQDKL
ncbi:huntingtin-interacting protein 1-like isoform X2 [Ornithodoros turicata]|uniref:Putative actin-binding protein n=1 Tax=Ornithodoros turicata TaxID=34597 RepID=A0A2R5LJD2_9ACAR